METTTTTTSFYFQKQPNFSLLKTYNFFSVFSTNNFYFSKTSCLVFLYLYIIISDNSIFSVTDEKKFLGGEIQWHKILFFVI